METAHLSIKPRPTEDMQIWIGWGLSPEMCPDGRGSTTSQALLNLFMGGCFKAVQTCWLKRQTLSFNTPGFRTPIVIILKTNSHVDIKWGGGDLERVKRGRGISPTLAGSFSRAASYMSPTWRACSLSLTTLPSKPFTDPPNQERHGIYWFCRLSTS